MEHLVTTEPFIHRKWHQSLCQDPLGAMFLEHWKALNTWKQHGNSMKQPGLGGYNPHDVKADATWQKCTAINWTKVAGEPTMEGKLSLPSIQMTGLWPGCGRDVAGMWSGMGSYSCNPLEIWIDMAICIDVANLVKLVSCNVVHVFFHLDSVSCWRIFELVGRQEKVPTLRSYSASSLHNPCKIHLLILRDLGSGHRQVPLWVNKNLDESGDFLWHRRMLEELELQDHCACPGPWCNVARPIPSKSA